MTRFAITARIARPRHRRIDGTLRKMMLLGWLVVIRGAGAQEALPPLPEFRMRPPALEEVQPSPDGVIPPGEDVPDAVPEAPPFQVGPVTLRPHFLYVFLYVNRILSSPGQQRSTAIHEIAPGLLSEIGSHWTLDYRPRWTVFSNPEFRDTFEQSVQLTGTATYEDWVFVLSQNYANYTPLLIETGKQTGLQTYSTAVVAAGPFLTKMSLDLAGSQVSTFASGFTDSREWRTFDWLNYRFQPRFDAGLGAGLGYANVQPGFDQTFEQYQARVRWQPTDKFGFEVHGGVEARQSAGPQAGELRNTIGGGLVRYRPSDSTTLFLNVNRGVALSLSANQVVEATSFSGILHQRLLEKLTLIVQGGYQIRTYVPIASGVSSGRRDKLYYVNTTLSCPFLKRGTISLLYGINNNDSNQRVFSFSGNLVGFEIAYQY